MKDMLLTYNEYNRDLGYVQGMSDLLAPIYAVMQDDAVAFWGFQHFMDRMERNFLRDQSGMRKQLLTLDHLVQLMDPKLYLHLQSADSTNFFFFFRMLLVWFKREFAWADVLRLWEGLWTDYLSSNFHLFIALAILEKHRDVIMEHLKHFDEVLKYSMFSFPLLYLILRKKTVNELSNTIDLPSTITRAEALFRRFTRTVEAIDRKSSFPAPKLRHRRLPSSSTIPTSPAPPESPAPKANTSGTDTVTAGGTNSGSPGPSGPNANTARPQSSGKDKGKRRSSDAGTNGDAVGQELEDQPERPKVISPELRELFSRKVEVLPRKVVRREGEGRSSLGK
jgi:hypothetical protein